MQKPKVSVLIPTVGRPSLARTLDSLINQTFTAWEAIVVANNATGAITLPDDERLTLVDAGTLERDTGASARNLAFQLAQAPYIATLDDDDWWEGGFLAAMTRRLARGDADLVYCRTTLRDRQSDEAYGTWLYPFDPAVLPKAGYILSPSVLFRREMLEGYALHADPRGRNSDWIFYVERHQAGFRFAHYDRLLANLCVDFGVWRYWAPGGFRKQEKA